MELAHTDGPGTVRWLALPYHPESHLTLSPSLSTGSRADGHAGARADRGVAEEGRMGTDRPPRRVRTATPGGRTGLAAGGGTGAGWRK